MAASRDLDGDEMLAEARRLGLPVVQDASMVDQLIGHPIGDRIPQDTTLLVPASWCVSGSAPLSRLTERAVGYLLEGLRQNKSFI
jgi:hypothetical protein